MVSAMEAVRSGTVSINKATYLHLVPHTTLKDRLSGRVVHGTKPGPKPYLTQEEETALCDHLIEAAKVDTAKSYTSQVDSKKCSKRKMNPKVKPHFEWLVV